MQITQNISDALEFYVNNGNVYGVSGTARKFGIKPMRLYYIIRQIGIPKIEPVKPIKTKPEYELLAKQILQEWGKTIWQLDR